MSKARENIEKLRLDPISEAPINGNTYGRFAETWVEVLPLTGGTISGATSFQSPPSSVTATEDFHLPRKDYVDSRIIKLTQNEYNNLTPDETTLYVIIG